MTRNHYEQAFLSWLKENKVNNVIVDDAKRAAFNHLKIKSFDLLIYPPAQKIIIAEIKGRSFKGKSLENLTGLDCWITLDDILSLGKWQKLFGTNHLAVFIFAFKIEKPDVDLDGREAYDFQQNRYLFFSINFQDYYSNMKTRSKKWQTITLTADNFRNFAVQLRSINSIKKIQ